MDERMRRIIIDIYPRRYGKVDLLINGVNDVSKDGVTVDGLKKIVAAEIDKAVESFD